MRILIIGGAGFLGANLVRYCLAQAGAEVTVLDSLEPRLRATTGNLADLGPRIRFVRGSVLEDADLAQTLPGQDIVFNCAAQTSHSLSMQDPLFDAEQNCIGGLKLLEGLRKLNPGATVVYASSSTLIGSAAGIVVDEERVERPLDIYSANKGAAEKYYRIYHRAHDLKTVALRFANLYGPYGKGSPEFGFVNYFIHVARTGGEIQIYGDGAQTRNVMLAEDAAAAMWAAARTPALLGEAWFAAHEEHLSVAEIAAAVVRAAGSGSIAYVPWPDARRRRRDRGGTDLVRPVPSTRRLGAKIFVCGRPGQGPGGAASGRAGMKLVITGALGHIGSRLIRSILPQEFAEVVLIDNLATQRYAALFGLRGDVGWRFVEADICDPRAGPRAALRRGALRGALGRHYGCGHQL